MRSPCLVVAAWGAALLLLHGCGSQTKTAPRALPKPMSLYASCTFDGGPALVSQTDRTRSDPVRMVKTAEGEKEVSVLDGVRLLYSYRGYSYFANVKVELSDPDRYSQDKRILLAELQHYQASGKDKTVQVQTKKIGRLDLVSLDYDVVGPSVLATESVIGQYAFFDDERHLVATIYLLNQKANKRAFQTIEAYRELRDKFLARFAECGNGEITPPTDPARQ